MLWFKVVFINYRLCLKQNIKSRAQIRECGTLYSERGRFKLKGFSCSKYIICKILLGGQIIIFVLLFFLYYNEEIKPFNLTNTLFIVTI